MSVLFTIRALPESPMQQPVPMELPVQREFSSDSTDCFQNSKFFSTNGVKPATHSSYEIVTVSLYCNVAGRNDLR